MWVKMRQLPCDFDQFWGSKRLRPLLLILGTYVKIPGYDRKIAEPQYHRRLIHSTKNNLIGT